MMYTGHAGVVRPVPKCLVYSSAFVDITNGRTHFLGRGGGPFWWFVWRSGLGF